MGEEQNRVQNSLEKAVFSQRRPRLFTVSMERQRLTDCRTQLSFTVFKLRVAK